MVSVHPNPPLGQGFTRFYNSHFSGEPPVSAPAMKTSEDNSTESSYWSAGVGVEDASKKVRKPYTITKSRENWTELEHDKFIEALHLFDRDWKKIEAFVGSKTVIQIRSHAQKHFMKVQKNGISEHVPPPRPKRKAAHPYPHKAPKRVASHPSDPSSSAPLLDSKYAVQSHSTSIPNNIITSVHSYPWTNTAPTGCISPISTDGFALSDGAMINNGSSNSNTIVPSKSASNRTNSRVKAALPDFSQVYSFIGSLFDPRSTSDHMEELKKMDPINIETVLLLMKNLAINLISPEFEDHRKLLSSYNGGIESESETSS